MNCDDAFDRMTHTGAATDAELHSHLAECRRCREMLDTLSPAIGLFEQDCHSLSSQQPWIDNSDSSTELATATAKRLSQSALPLRRSLVLFVTLACSLCVGVGIGWSGTAMLNALAAPGQALASTPSCLYLSDNRPTGISSSQMMQNCLACHQIPRHE